MKCKRTKLGILLAFISLAAWVICFGQAAWWRAAASAQETKKPASMAGAAAPRKDRQSNNSDAQHEHFAPNSPPVYDPKWKRPYPQFESVGEDLLPFPELNPGDITPTDLYRYGGPGKSSYASISDVADFDEFYNRLSGQKAKVMARWKDYLDLRYNFSSKTDPQLTMTRGKPVPVGPVALLPKGIGTGEELAGLSASEIYKRDLFPEGFRPLAHPLQSTGHMLFPQMSTKQHPEDIRFDVDFDLPEAYLPEFPPPLFLTTRPDLGDVSQGCEITEANFHKLFDGILTPEQLKGLEKLVIKSNTSWFNQTKHRLTKNPSQGIACFDCHVNGHTNGAIEMDPSTRPTLARVRLDTPSLRGNNTNLMFSLRRSIRSVDHFAEVEEYFDGDISLLQQIGGREFNKATTNVMGDFNSIIAYPPAPKLNRLGRLDSGKATESELRGEKLFFGKASCSECHLPPYYTDNQMHDLRVEEFYHGRAEGWAKTFSLRGIKDSPPYFHDGRLPTLEDAVEFFNVIFGLKLARDEKEDLVTFLQCL